MSILGDVRLDSVKSRLLSAMESRQSIVLRQLSNNRKEEVSYGRYINNHNISPELIVQSHSEFFIPLCSNTHVLLVEDTTTASFGLNSTRGELGYVGKSKSISGFNLHPVIGLNALNGAFLGLFGLLDGNVRNPKRSLLKA